MPGAAAYAVKVLMLEGLRYAVFTRRAYAMLPSLRQRCTLPLRVLPTRFCPRKA